MDLPFAADLLGDAQPAGVERVQRMLDRVAHHALGGGVQLLALVPGLLDGLGESHGPVLTALKNALRSFVS